MEGRKCTKTDCTTSGSEQFKLSKCSQEHKFKKRFKDSQSRLLSWFVASHVPIVTLKGHPQKKGIKPDVRKTEIKHVKDVSFVNQCLFAKSVPNVVKELGVGGRLQTFWPKWQELGANPRVVSILKEGYALPFKMRPPLTRFPLIQSGYAKPAKSRSLTEALYALIEKLVVEKVVVRKSLSFYNRLFLVPMPNSKWRPILDLSQLNGYLQTNTFEMETPETTRVSLQQGEWVTLLDFSDAYFHIPIQPRSRKYLSKAYQFTALPFGLATAPLEFTKVVKEVKLMAQTKGIRIHQYLDDWLLRAQCPEICQQHTQTLLALCRELGWVVNMKKSELVPQQVFNFVGYRFDLSTSRVLPTPYRWETLQKKLRFIKDKDTCTVRHLMSLIGLLTATEKQVWSGRLHMRPIQWHLKRHWHVPEILEKVIPVPRALHPHLDWWLNEDSVLRGQPLHPLSHALQLFTDASNEGWGAHLGDSTARGVSSNQDSCRHINVLELKAVFLALKSLKHLCKCQIVLVATDNTTVVSYINKEGGMKSGSLCALLWRILSWCHHREIILRARHIPGHLNVIADKLSRHRHVGDSTDRPVRHQIQQQIGQVCVSGSGPGSMGCRCPESPMGDSGRVSLSTGLSPGEGSVQSDRPGLSQDDPHCTGLAQHVMVLGSSLRVKSDSGDPSGTGGSGDSGTSGI